MPISNPILHGLTVTTGGADVIIALTDPLLTPERAKVFWLNSVGGGLFLSTDSNSVGDWEKVSGSPEQSSPMSQISTNIILGSNARYLVAADNLICSLPPNPAIGDTIDISNGNFFSFRINHGNEAQFILYNGLFTPSGVNSGLELKHYADCQMFYQGENYWRVTYAIREINVFDGTDFREGLPYVASEKESYAYYFANTLNKINDGNLTHGVMKTGGGTDNKFIIKCTFAAQTKLNNISIIGGQFNGAYNCPDEVRVYKGDSIDPIDLLNEFTDLTVNGSMFLVIDSADYLMEYTLEFTSLTSPTAMSISELFLYGDI